MKIYAPCLFRGGRFTGPACVAIEDGRIAAILDPGIADGETIHLDRGFLAPGLTDLHNNGAFGIDCAAADPADIVRFARRLARCGVTTVLPTIITAPIAELQASARRIRAAICEAPGDAAAMPGLHLEGPFLAPAKRGAHRADWLRLPDAATLDALLADDALRDTLRLLTIAPELPEALAAIARLDAAGIAVSLGHSDADADQAARGIAAGARMVTHVFNAMRSLHHREPGLAGLALADPRVFACLIVDGIHVDPIALRLAFAAAGSHAVAVTDSAAVAGLADGATAQFGGATAILRHGAARRPDGSLCGAAIALDEGLRRLRRSGIAPEAALAAATDAPARALGLADRGRIAAGLRADLVWFDDDFSVRDVWITGASLLGIAPEPRPARRHVALPLTETGRADLADLDTSDEEGIITALLETERRGQDALADAQPALAALASAIAQRLKAGGRLFYVGAGTSGRLAVLDAVECGPTFSLPPGIIVPILAGGMAAMTEAVEGAEDAEDAARAAIAEHEVTGRDIVVGIAASGRTGFVRAALEAARAAGAATGAIVNASGGPIEALADLPVLIATGPETITGSTRLAAGTTQKIALNALSTTAMIRLGKTFGPLMVDVRATNAKLRDRAARIVSALAFCAPDESAETLAACGFEVKTAIVMRRLDLDAATARQRLDAARGRLRHVLDAAAPPP